MRQTGAKRIRTINILMALLIMCLCLGAAPAVAEDNSTSLSVPLVTGLPGATVQVPVNLNSAGQVLGVQFELNFTGELISFQSGEKGAFTANYNLAVSSQGANKIRVIITSPANAPIAGGTGSVAILRFKVSDTAEAGQTCPLALTSVVLAGSGGSEIKPVGQTDGVFRVVPPLKVQVIDTTGQRGSVAQVPLNLTSQGQVAGIQLDLSYDDQLLDYQGIETGSLGAGFNAQANNTGGGKLKVMLVKQNATTIPPGSGPVALLNFKVRDSAQTGQSCQLALSNVRLADSAANNLGSAELIDGKFTVIPGGSISLTVSPASVSLTAGGQQQLSVSVTPSDSTISYTTGNSSVASVDESGRITAVSSGSTVITVTASKAGYQNAIQEVPVSVSSGGGGGGGGGNGTPTVSLTVEPQTANLSVAETLQLKAVVSPSDATVRYSSGNSGVATVDGSGKITAVGKGKADITVTASRAGYHDATKVVSVTVEDFKLKGLECTFYDVTSTHWAFGIIGELCSKGYVKGYPGGAFKPDNNITRAEFTRILTKVLGLSDKKPAASMFSDITPADWYYGAVQAAAGAGIVKGYDNGKFLPDQNISREEMAVILVNALGKREEALSRAGDETIFTDDRGIASWARGFVVIAVQEGLVKGYPDNTFRPGNNATRAEACAIIVRYMEKK